jgi:hypothetical protein
MGSGDDERKWFSSGLHFEAKSVQRPPILPHSAGLAPAATGWAPPPAPPLRRPGLREPGGTPTRSPELNGRIELGPGGTPRRCSGSPACSCGGSVVRIPCILAQRILVIAEGKPRCGPRTAGVFPFRLGGERVVPEPGGMTSLRRERPFDTLDGTG